MEKLPPIAKVYEAWSAVADGRVKLHPDRAACNRHVLERRKGVHGVLGRGRRSVLLERQRHVLAGLRGLPRHRRAHGAGRTPARPSRRRSVRPRGLDLPQRALQARLRRGRRARRRGTRPRRRPRGSRRADRLRRPAALDLAVKRGSVRPPRTKKAYGEVFATRTDEASKGSTRAKTKQGVAPRYTDRDGNGSAEGAPWPTRNAR